MVPTPTIMHLFDISMVSADEGWAVGTDTLLHFINGTWSEVEFPITHCNFERTLGQVEMLSATEGWATGDCGTFLHYTTGTAILEDPVNLYLPIARGGAFGQRAR